MFDKKILSVYWVAGTQDCRRPSHDSPEQALLGTLETALQNGITCFQFREKGACSLQDERRKMNLAYACRDLCRQYGVPFVLNNDVRAAVNMGADGVHIGQRDMSVQAASALCANRLFLGMSHNSVADLQRSLVQKVGDYWAVGAIFATPSKADAVSPLGLDFVREARKLCGRKPLVAIGGVSVDNASAVREAGADGVAVISAIARAKDVATAVRQLRGVD